MIIPMHRYTVFLWAMLITYVVVISYAAPVRSSVSLMAGLLLGGVGVLWVSLLWRFGWQIQQTSLDASLLAIIVALVLSACFSLDPSRSWRMFWNWSVCILVFYIAIVFLRTIQPNPVPIIIVYLLILAVITLIAYITLVRWTVEWYAIFGLNLGLPQLPRAASFYGGPNMLAILLNFGLLLGWGVCQNYKKSYWQIALLLFLMPALLLTGSRSGWLGFLVGVFVLFGAGWWRRQNAPLTVKAIGRFLGTLVVLVLVLWFMLFMIRPETLRMSDNFFVLYRAEFWSIAWRMWLEQPLLGQGLDTFGSFFLLYNPSVPPAFPFRAAHSLWMSLLAETGIVGASAAISCWLLLGRWLWNRRQSYNWSPFKLSLLATLAAFTVHATFDTPDLPILFLTALWLAMLMTSDGAVCQPGFPTWLTVWTVPLWCLLLLVGAWVYPAMREYEEGVAAVRDGDRHMAVTHFANAQSRTPYIDTGTALAQGLTYGWLASEDVDYLSQAIVAYENLIAHEPGWPTNYANLAALYWQMGEVEQALMLMARAQSIAPKIPLYTLNLALWQEEIDQQQAAIANYRELVQMQGVWKTPLFWEATPARQAITIPLTSASRHQSAWQALQNKDWQMAEEAYNGMLQDNPRDGVARAGLGIKHLFTGNEAAAQERLTEAMLLNRRYTYLWVFLLGDPTGDFLTMFQQSNTFGATRSNAHIYPTAIFSRPGMPYDILPQLYCFSLDENTSQHLMLLSNWPLIDQSILQSLQATNTQGLVPCSQP